MLFQEILLKGLEWAACVTHEHVLGKMKIFERLINVVTNRW
jgi:hypothetical protein